MSNDNKRKRTKAQMLEDAEIARIKASVSFTAPEIYRDDLVLPEKEDLDRSTTALGSFDVRGNAEAEGEVLKAKEVIAKETPKEKEPISKEELLKNRANQEFNTLYNSSEGIAKGSSAFFLSQYQKACKDSEINCPEINSVAGPTIRYTSDNTIETSRLPAAWNKDEYKDKIDQFAVNVSNKYIRMYGGNTDVAKAMAEAEFKALSQVMIKNGITPDSPTFDRMASLRSPIFGREADRGALGNLSEHIATKAQSEKQAKAQTQTQAVAMNKSQGRE
ncbi:MAG: hypothetical protein J6C85_04805 [Alphaproteobacteria bacterium]|nr:hypothetical protein [Alphaproteobacteria bacterium]